MIKPKIFKKNSSKKINESGCCFRSCGGSPVILQDDPIKIYKGDITEKKLRKIK